MSKLLDDNCCFICKGAHGICLTKGGCEHHVDARRRQDANDRAMQTHRDPTGNQAVNNVMRETRAPKPKAAPNRPFSYPKEDR